MNDDEKFWQAKIAFRLPENILRLFCRERASCRAPRFWVGGAERCVLRGLGWADF